MRPLLSIQLTWVSNEIEGYDAVVFEFIDRLAEPKGWLLKLWEVVVPGGLVIFLTAPTSNWDQTAIGYIISNRQVYNYCIILYAFKGSKTNCALYMGLLMQYFTILLV